MNEAKDDIEKRQQIYISADGPEGAIIQTTVATYEDYYRQLGYQILGPANHLPLPLSHEEQQY